VELVAGALLILLSGFYSGSETAVYRAHWIRLTAWSERRKAGAKLALRLLDWREPTVIAVLVGTNLANVFSSVLVSGFVAETFGPAWTGAAVVVLVALTLVFGEYAPKALAQVNPNRWLARASVPMAASLGLFGPVVLLLSGVARVFATPFAERAEKRALSRHDFLSAIRQRERSDNGNGRNGLKPSASISAIASRLFSFSGMRLSEAAIPLEQVHAVPEGSGRGDVMEVVEEHGFSRIPVYRGEKGNIVGVVYAKDLLAGTEPPVRRMEHVSDNERAMAVLARMQRVGGHMAVVVDSDGRTTGIVTLEDILEEMVGEIRSED